MKQITKTSDKIIHRIVRWDCLEVMKKIPDHYIDFICSDFPYNISKHPWLTFRGDRIVRTDFWERDKRDSPLEYLNFVFKVCREYKRILKPNANMVLFFGYRYAWRIAYELERRGLFTFRTPIIFNKTNPLPHIRKNGFRSCYEMWVRLVNDGWRFSRPKTFNFLWQGKMKNVLNYRIGKEWNKQTKHPTEKPEFLIWWLVEVFTNPWEIVLDSFAWWWTTWVASYKAGRNCISIEKEAGFIQTILKRQEMAERGK